MGKSFRRSLPVSASRCLNYCAVDNGEPKLLKSLPIDASGYTDGSTTDGALHLYVLRLVLPDGTESEPSEPVGMRW